jgi:hypothetical protein
MARRVSQRYESSLTDKSPSAVEEDTAPLNYRIHTKIEIWKSELCVWLEVGFSGRWWMVMIFWCLYIADTRLRSSCAYLSITPRRSAEVYSALDRGARPALHNGVTSVEKAFSTYWTGVSQSGCLQLPGLEFRFVCHPVCSTVTIPTELSRLRIVNRGVTYGDRVEGEAGMEITAFWDVIVCNLVCVYQHFGGTCWLHLQGFYLYETLLQKSLIFIVKAVGFWDANYVQFQVLRRPPLWSWLQIRRPGFDYRHYQEKKVVGLERGALNLVRTTEELLDKK